MIKQFAGLKILDLIILYRRDSYHSISSVTKYFSPSNKNVNMFIFLLWLDIATIQMRTRLFDIQYNQLHGCENSKSFYLSRGK